MILRLTVDDLIYDPDVLSVAENMRVIVPCAFESTDGQKQQNICLVFAHVEHVCFFLFSAKVESLTIRNSAAPEEDEPKETFVAFARVYSGVVKKGQRLFVLGPKYDPAQYLCMVNSSTNSTVSPYCKKLRLCFI